MESHQTAVAGVMESDYNGKEQYKTINWAFQQANQPLWDKVRQLSKSN